MSITEEKLKTGVYSASEIGRLRKVLLHRPGRELENLMPDYLERLLFADVPFLQVAQAEHDAFADCLRESGAEVVYLRDLVAETMAQPGLRREMTEQFLDEAGLEDHRIRDILNEYFSDMSEVELTDTMIAGVRKSEVRAFEAGRPAAEADEYPFLTDPMPNLYFTRDPFAVIGRGVALHRMRTLTRRREGLFGRFIFKYHPLYKDTPKWYDLGETGTLEGGDVLLLSPEVVAVGVSQWTAEDSIEKFAHTVLSISGSFRKILAFDIPKKRSFTHLDSVLAMADRDKFIVHPDIIEEIGVFVMELEDGQVRVREERGSLEDILKRHLGLERVRLIPAGGGEGWEQCGALAIAPGEVVICGEGGVAGRILEDSGIIVHAVACPELSRGRGGARGMAMPLIRDDI